MKVIHERLYLYERVHIYTHMIRKQRSIIDNERGKQILPEGAIQVLSERSSNLKELLAPSNPFRTRELTAEGCFACTA